MKERLLFAAWSVACCTFGVVLADWANEKHRPPPEPAAVMEIRHDGRTVGDHAETTIKDEDKPDAGHWIVDVTAIEYVGDYPMPYRWTFTGDRATTIMQACQRVTDQTGAAVSVNHDGR